MPDSGLGTVGSLPHLILKILVRAAYYNGPHFTDEETGSERLSVNAAQLMNNGAASQT